jgi:hypothetical protein
MRPDGHLDTGLTAKVRATKREKMLCSRELKNVQAM